MSTIDQAPFPFLELPPEIRNTIYTHLFPPPVPKPVITIHEREDPIWIAFLDVETAPREFSSDRAARSYKRWQVIRIEEAEEKRKQRRSAASAGRRHETIGPSDRALMYTSRQLRWEVASVYYGHHCFRFEHGPSAYGIPLTALRDQSLQGLSQLDHKDPEYNAILPRTCVNPFLAEFCLDMGGDPETTQTLGINGPPPPVRPNYLLFFTVISVDIMPGIRPHLLRFHHLASLLVPESWSVVAFLAREIAPSVESPMWQDLLVRLPLLREIRIEKDVITLWRKRNWPAKNLYLALNRGLRRR